MFKSTACINPDYHFQSVYLKDQESIPNISPRDFENLFWTLFGFQHVSLYVYQISYKLMLSYCGFDVEKLHIYLQFHSEFSLRSAVVNFSFLLG